MHDVQYDDRRLPILNVIDEANREAPAIRVAQSLPASVLIRTPCESTAAGRTSPEPGKPNPNAYIERFNRTLRTEVLGAYLFNPIEQVQAIAHNWLTQYDEYRQHDALRGLPPKDFTPD